MGHCVCDNTTCAGCCFGGIGGGAQCFAGTLDQACGHDGGMCQFCNGTSRCIDGGCG
jgi:hypothetical protein